MGCTNHVGPLGSNIYPADETDGSRGSGETLAPKTIATCWKPITKYSDVAIAS